MFIFGRSIFKSNWKILHLLSILKDGNQVYVGAVGSWYWQGKTISFITQNSLKDNYIKLVNTGYWF